jgi:frataxin-like iron-binding protein CyaY
VFENWVVSKMSGHKMDEVTGQWRRLLTKYYLCDKIKNSEMGWVCSLEAAHTIWTVL